MKNTFHQRALLQVTADKVSDLHRRRVLAGFPLPLKEFQLAFLGSVSNGTGVYSLATGKVNLVNGFLNSRGYKLVRKDVKMGMYSWCSSSKLHKNKLFFVVYCSLNGVLLLSVQDA